MQKNYLKEIKSAVLARLSQQIGAQFFYDDMTQAVDAFHKIRHQDSRVCLQVVRLQVNHQPTAAESESWEEIIFVSPPFATGQILREAIALKQKNEMGFKLRHDRGRKQFWRNCRFTLFEVVEKRQDLERKQTEEV